MKKCLFIIASLCFLAACNSSKNKGSANGPQIPVVPDSVDPPRIIANFLKRDTTAGKVGCDFIWAKIGKSIDSNDKVKRDTFYGIPKYIVDTAMDPKTKQPVYDTTNKKYVMVTIPVLDYVISKDSVNIYNIERVPYDSLLRRSAWRKKY